jgi:hypothetical protein
MTPITKNFKQCDFCINRIKNTNTCKAFLECIPKKFLNMVSIHNKKENDEKFIFKIDLKKLVIEL